MSLEDRVFALESWVRMMADLNIPKRLAALDTAPSKLPDEKFMGMIAAEMVKQNLARVRP
jgi:hypothetical protein